MGWVFIDTSIAGVCRFGLLTKNGEGIMTKNIRANGLLAALEEEIDRNAFRAVSGICVVRGPGSFSAVRSGVLVANVLARCFQKPLVSILNEDAKDLALLERRLAVGEFHPQSTVLPLYDAEPNITRKVPMNHRETTIESYVCS